MCVSIHKYSIFCQLLFYNKGQSRIACFQQRTVRSQVAYINYHCLTVKIHSTYKYPHYIPFSMFKLRKKHYHWRPKPYPWFFYYFGCSSCDSLTRTSFNHDVSIAHNLATRFCCLANRNYRKEFLGMRT